MPGSDNYLVPLDFSRGSEKALNYALALARERKAKLVALHVVPAELIYPPTGGRFDFYGLLERDARENFRKLAKRKNSSRRIVNSLSLAGRTSPKLSLVKPRKCARP
jgi:nucleotide-binding universal stress UspA family protein